MSGKATPSELLRKRNARLARINRARWLALERQAQRELEAALAGQLRLILAAEGTAMTATLDASMPALANALLGVLQDAAGLGVEQAEAQLSSIGLSIDWTLPNTAARDWAREYAYGLVRGINDTSREFLQKEIAQWTESGEPLSELSKRLTDMFGERRAGLIASTEVTRAYTNGNIAGWRASGMVDRDPEQKSPLHPGCRCGIVLQMEPDGSWIYVWRTAMDELVCPECGDLADQSVGIAREAPVD